MANITSTSLKDHELSIGNIHYDYTSAEFSISKFHIKNKAAADKTTKDLEKAEYIVNHVERK